MHLPKFVTQFQQGGVNSINIAARAKQNDNHATTIDIVENISKSTRSSADN